MRTHSVQLFDRPELLRRAAIARQELHHCNLCELRCNIDRTQNQKSPCGLNAESYTFKRHISLAEEARLLPSYMVYFGGCNFRCAFCVQGPTCFDTFRGQSVNPSELARDCAIMVDKGARTINLLGGEPTLHLHTLLEIAAEAKEALPLVLNSNFYMTPQVLELLRGIIHLYLADFKFGNDACAKRIAGIDRYNFVVQRNLLIAKDHGELMVRHLLMPGHYDCCFVPVAHWMAEHLPRTPFSLMCGYVPAYRAGNAQTPELGGVCDVDDIDRAWSLVGSLGLTRAQ